MDRAVHLMEERRATQEAASRELRICRQSLRSLVSSKRDGRDPMIHGRPKLLTREEEHDLVFMLQNLNEKQSLDKALIIHEVGIHLIKKIYYFLNFLLGSETL